MPWKLSAMLSPSVSRTNVMATDLELLLESGSVTCGGVTAMVSSTVMSQEYGGFLVSVQFTVQASPSATLELPLRLKFCEKSFGSMSQSGVSLADLETVTLTGP